MPVADEKSNKFERGQIQPLKDENTSKVKVDPSDPRVKKLVYNMYRDMLTNYSDDANDFISQKDPSQVTIDYGIGPILQTIMRGNNSNSSGQSGGSSESQPPQNTGGSMAPPPPPPPMAGAIPSQRLNSEIGMREKGPPMALAGAMMKDKKPFTYTPGGIDLSEIRSPRMAKRLQMNAAAEGVTSTPQSRAAHEAVHAGIPPTNSHHPHLPPAAMAAMQPQMAIPVFPQGGFDPSTLSRAPKPSDFTDGSGNAPNNHYNQQHGIVPTPPPPPPPMKLQQQNFSSQESKSSSPTRPIPKPVPVVVDSSPTVIRVTNAKKAPTPPPIQNTQNENQERVSMPMSSHHQNLQNITHPGPDNNINIEGRSSPNTNRSQIQSQVKATNVGTGSIYIPPLSPPTHDESPSQTPRGASPRNLNARQTKAQAASQNLGSIYIPPIEQRPSSVFSNPNVNSNVSTPRSQISTPNTASTNNSNTPSTGLSTPQLNKAPTPWMNSYNKMASKQAESPPYVNPSNIMTPWGTLGAPPPPPNIPMQHMQSMPMQMTQGAVRTIPISIARDDDVDGSFSPQAQGAGQVQGPPGPFVDERTNAAQHLGRVIPIQIQRQESHNQQLQQQAWARTIPIQIEGRQQSGLPSPPGAPMTQGRRAPLPTAYNNPMGLYSNQNAAQAYQQQTQLASGIKNMTMGNESPRLEPAQSKSMRVIQKVAENELKKYEGPLYPQYQNQPDEQNGGWGCWQEMEDDRWSLHNLLRTQGYPVGSQGAGPGPVTHNIQIRMTPQSPTPSQQQQHLPPSEQRSEEPKKYMGSNIPSRSFKILQAMTAEDDSSRTSGTSDM